MSYADKDECADNDVQRGISRNKYQDALCVRCQPNVILANKELKEKTRFRL